jgi:chloramphenicol 3-O-phosphotransferase
MGLEERVKRLEQAGVNASGVCALCEERARKQLENERGGRREGWAATETSRSDATCPACGRELQIVVRVLERAA